MLYAVSVETTRPVGRGRMVRRVNVFVDARNGDEAQYLARLRFRHRPEARTLVIRAVRGVTLKPPAPAEQAKQGAPPPKQKRPKGRGRRRKSKPSKPRGDA